MIKVCAFIMIVFFSIGAKAQLNPVSWTFTARKVNDKKYEISMLAVIQPGWHLYSQVQPAGAIALPTDIKFIKNPLIIIDGKTKETGRMIKFKDANLGVSANQYSDRVTFIQSVKLTGAAKTNVVGTVEYQTCDNKRCLPPKTVNFNVLL